MFSPFTPFLFTDRIPLICVFVILAIVVIFGIFITFVKPLTPLSFRDLLYLPVSLHWFVIFIIFSIITITVIFSIFVTFCEAPFPTLFQRFVIFASVAPLICYFHYSWYNCYFWYSFSRLHAFPDISGGAFSQFEKRTCRKKKTSYFTSVGQSIYCTGLNATKWRRKWENGIINLKKIGTSYPKCATRLWKKIKKERNDKYQQRRT